MLTSLKLRRGLRWGEPKSNADVGLGYYILRIRCGKKKAKLLEKKRIGETGDS